MNFQQNMIALCGAGAVGLLCLMAGPASADMINLATGQNSSGHVWGSGDNLDANWQVTNANNYLTSAPNAYTVFPNNADWYGGWTANGPHSDWIAADPDNSNNGAMTFTLTFNLTDPANDVFKGGFWTIDDQGTLTLNGHLLSTLGNGQWGSMHAFTIPQGDLVAGLNTLVMQITATDDYLEGARLEGVITDNVPEPGTLSLFAAALLGLGGLSRRRKAA